MTADRRKPSLKARDTGNSMIDQPVVTHRNNEHHEHKHLDMSNHNIRTEEPEPLSPGNGKLSLAQLDLGTDFNSGLHFAPSEFGLDSEHGDIEFWKAETVKLRDFLGKMRIDNKRLEAEAEELAENYAKLLTKHNKATTAALMARSQRGVSEATIKDEFEELSRQVLNWVDEASYTFRHSLGASQPLEAMLSYLGLPPARSLALSPACVSSIITVLLWRRLLEDVFPTVSKPTDLWATGVQAQAIFDVEQSMLDASDSVTEIQSWLCTTANVLMPGLFTGNGRSTALTNSLWNEILRLWQVDTATAASETIKKMLHREVIVPAVSLSLQLRKGRSSMLLQLPASTVSAIERTHYKLPAEMPGYELFISPELRKVTSGITRSDENTVIVDSKSRLLLWQK